MAEVKSSKFDAENGGIEYDSFKSSLAQVRVNSFIFFFGINFIVKYTSQIRNRRYYGDVP